MPWLTMTNARDSHWRQEGHMEIHREQGNVYFQSHPTDLACPAPYMKLRQTEVWFCLTVPPSLPRGGKWLVWWVALLWTSTWDACMFWLGLQSLIQRQLRPHHYHLTQIKLLMKTERQCYYIAELSDHLGKGLTLKLCKHQWGRQVHKAS